MSGLYSRTAHGTDRGNIPLVCTYLGVAEGLRYIAPFIEDEFLSRSDRVDTCPVPDTELATAWHDASADLIVVVANAATIDALRGPTDLWGVARIHQVAWTADGRESLLARMSRREVRRGEEARLNGYHFDVSQRDEDFDHFYQTMHRPTMNNRYGERARSVPEDQARTELFRRGVLFRIFHRDIWVAGSVSQIDMARRRLNARLIGVRDGDDAYRLAGAQNFVYHAILDWACADPAIDEVDFQGCEPFLSKGTFQYKKRFGTAAVLPDNAFSQLRMLLRGDLSRPSVRDFLVANPLLTYHSDIGLSALYCHDASRPARLELPYTSNGIVGHALVNLDELADAARALPSDFGEPR